MYSIDMLWEVMLTFRAVSWNPKDGYTISQSHRLYPDDAMGIGGSPEDMLQLTNALPKTGQSHKGVAVGDS